MTNIEYLSIDIECQHQERDNHRHPNQESNSANSSDEERRQCEERKIWQNE